MYQILGLRSIKNGGKPVEVFFEKGWRTENLSDFFNEERVGAILRDIPSDEHWNLYYTIADCFEERGRKLKEQWAIPFDIDNLAIRTELGLITEEAKKDLAINAVRAAARALNVDFNDLAIVFSGNGVQFFILLDKPIISIDYFNQKKESYIELAKAIQEELKKDGIAGNVDTSVFSKARLMRLPNTLNKKAGRQESRAFIIQSGRPISFDLDDAGINTSQDVEYVRVYPKPDTVSVCEGCAFLKHCKTNQADVKEPQWFAMSTILVRLDDGAKLMHEYSNQHPSYSSYETDVKIEHALENTKPRTCRDIATRWDGCTSCEYYGKVTSPIMIKGPDYIGSGEFGYREQLRKETATGEIKIIPGKPVYDDIVKAFAKRHAYYTLMDSKEVHAFNGTHWVIVSDIEISSWLSALIKPSPSTTEVNEALGRIKMQRVMRREQMQLSTKNLMNFRNHVVNFQTGETFPHSVDYGFTSVIPYDYDPYAQAPTWDKFMDDITEGDKEKRAAIEEFCGYCISGDYYWLHKVLFLLGSGANGKSVLLKTLGKIAGAENHSTVAIKELVNSTDRHALVNKLFNYSEETSYKSLDDSDMFKKLSSGGSMRVRVLYVGTFEVVNNAKFICSTNELPKNFDTSNGMYRRLAIIRLNATFAEGHPNTDPYIEQKLEKELSGICNKLIAAYRNLKERGILSYAEGIRKEVQEYREENDTVLLYFKDAVELTFDEEDVVKVTELYSDYKIYCEMNGLKPLSNVHFGRSVNKEFDRKSFVKNINGKSSRVYGCLVLKKDY